MLKKIDLLFFNAPYEISLLVTKINFVIFLLSMQHRTHGFFQNIEEGHDNEIRDDIINNSIKKSFKIFVGAEKDKNLLIKFFNADENKIIIQPYTFTLPNLYKGNLNYDYKKLFNDLALHKKKKYLFILLNFKLTKITNI